MATKDKKRSKAQNDIDFDAVQFMRDQRKKLSKKLSQMSAKEIVEYFAKRKGKVKPSA